MSDPPADIGQAGEDAGPAVEVHDGQGLIIGPGGRQTNYFYASSGVTGHPPLVTFSGEIESPYSGMAPFGEQDAAFFFGREAAAAEILKRLSGRLDTPALLVISGVSGAGKSSLMQAGVLPRIAEAGLTAAPGGRPWPHVVLTPARAPLTELAGHVAPLISGDAVTLRQSLRADPSGFALTALEAVKSRRDAATRGAEGRLLLIVDQFEQVFTQCADEVERRGFFTALHAAATTGHGSRQVPAAMVVLVVRADFEARCADYDELAEAVQDRYLLRPMTERQLRLAVTEPTRVLGSSVDDALVEELVRAVRAAPGLGTARHGEEGRAGVLPHLSHALDQAWRGRTGDMLTLADYERVGGIEGSIGASADRAYATLSAAQQETARKVFTRLAATSADGTDVSVRRTRAELAQGDALTAAADVDAVLEAFAAERLLTLAADSVEISHEALLTAWPLLSDIWLAENRADRIARTRLQAAAADWAAHARNPAYLYRGTLLNDADSIAARIRADPARHPALSTGERNFLRASSRAGSRAAGWRRASIAGLAVLTAIAVVVAGLAARYAGRADQQHAIALSRQLAAESLAALSTNPATAGQLAIAAWAVSHTRQASSIMSILVTEQRKDDMLPADSAGVNGVAFSPDGTLLATADGDGTVQLWSPATGQPVGAPLPADTRTNGTVNDVAFSPNGKLLATADGDGTVRLWTPGNRKPAEALVPATALWGDPGAVAFSPDGKLLAAAYSNDRGGMVQLWNPDTGRTVRAPMGGGDAGGGSVSDVAFSPDGKLLAIAAGGTVQLWNPATGQAVGPPLAVDSGTDAVVNDIAFSPDSKLLAVAGSNGTVQLWNPGDGQSVAASRPAEAAGLGDVARLAFSPDGKLLAAADVDGTVRLWNPATGHTVRTLPPARTAVGGTINAMAFSPDSQLLATAESGGAVQLWDPATGKPATGALHSADTGLKSSINGIAISPDGTLVATADSDGTVRLWNSDTGQPVRAPLPVDTKSGGSANAVTFSPNGRLLATAETDSNSGTVRLWNPATGKPVRRPLPGAGNADGIAFSPDGSLLAIADSNGTVQLWNPDTGRPVGAPLPVEPGSRGISAAQVVFSPRSSLLATDDSNGTVRLWNAATGHPVGGPLLANTIANDDGVNEMAFSPDGKVLAATDVDGTVRLWNATTGKPVRAPLPVDPKGNGSINELAFSPDGKLLAIADNSGNGTVRLWSPVTGKPVETIPEGNVNALAFSPHGRLLVSAHDNTVQTWAVLLVTKPYTALCTDVGPLTRRQWDQDAPGEPFPGMCS